MPEIWSTTARTAPAEPSRRKAPGVEVTAPAPPTPAGAVLRLPVQHLHEVDPPEVGERLHVHALVQLELVGVDLGDPADRDAAREERLEPRGA